MASSNTTRSCHLISLYTTSFTIFFLLLFTVHSSMAARDVQALLHNSTTRFGEGDAKLISKDKRNIPHEVRFRRGHRSPLPWQEKMLNASAHEVPSGPNPISNR
ncbi:CLAVATA3/ESR (CLE)-related protein TDIF-like [Mercurialis annua]|uniref:CLAVATA3/ESR (CLE)-related protein TDIF-like n=1 Tax=Mercurialis annua TaxID=3986 RepID=UPI00215DD7C9|nr:CLAVATA3/ESR (CLE)-related protein TDIF-like [Mercurialis annua]